MTDADLLTLCVLQEAGNQPTDGQAAVAQVVLNRTRLRYSSDGTVMGTILRHAQFSWTEFAMTGAVYHEVARDGAQEEARVASLMVEAKAEACWRGAAAIVGEVQHGAYRGALYGKLTPSTVLYDNLSLTRPAWVADSRLIVKIAAHSFFEPVGMKAAPSAVAAPSANFGADATRKALEA